MPSTVSLAGWLLAVVATVSLTACGSSGNYSRAAAPARPNPDATVRLVGLTFSPDKTTIRVGQTVAWEWDKPAVVHDVAFKDGAASERQASGSWERTFTTAGTYPYKCTLHPGMEGKVVVT